MIREDDFLLDDAFADAVKVVAENIDEYGFIRMQSERKAKKRLVKQTGMFQLWRYTKVPHSTMCYGISPPVAETFVVTEGQVSYEPTIEVRKKAKKPLKIKVLRPVIKLGWFLNRIGFNLGISNGL